MSTTTTDPTTTPVTALVPVSLTTKLTAVAAFLTSLGAAAVGVANVLPSGEQSTALAIAGVIGVVATAIQTLVAEQKTQTNRAQVTVATASLAHDAYTSKLETRNESLEGQLSAALNSTPDIPSTSSGANLPESDVPDSSVRPPDLPADVPLLTPTDPPLQSSIKPDPDPS
jgi:hypothetical protein